jgi:hypothetical protein
LLPEQGTRERRELENEALAIALNALDLEHGNIPNALYAVYMTYRTQFIRERSLPMGTANPSAALSDALLDARQLEAFVNDAWAMAIRPRDDAHSAQAALKATPASPSE